MVKAKRETKGLNLLRIQWGDTMNICQAETRHVVAAQAEKALVRGETVTWEDGRKEWLEIIHIVDLAQRGSQMYIWDKAGDKVKADIFRVTKTRSGIVTKRKIGTKFVRFD